MTILHYRKNRRALCGNTRARCGTPYKESVTCKVCLAKLAKIERDENFPVIEGRMFKDWG